MKIICGEKNDREVVETEDFLTIIDWLFVIDIHRTSFLRLLNKEHLLY
jgi:hypothetical protein